MPNLYNSLLERLEGRQYSNYFACFCPFESHKSPAMLVYDDGLFVCLSCGRKGTHVYLDKKIGSHFIPTQKLDTVSRVLPTWRKWESRYGDLEGIVEHAHHSLKKFHQFQAYFKVRKIEGYIDEGHLGFCDGWATFPVYDKHGRLVDIVVRSTSNKSVTRYVVMPKSSTDLRPLYCPSWKALEASETVYVVYGIIDAISMHLCGLPVVTGMGGKSLSAELLRPLHKKMVILPDDGEEAEAHKLANQLGWRAHVKEINYPYECKDPDGIRREFGNTALLNLIGA